MIAPAGLPAIITAARAGAISHAERLFREGGHGRRSDDAATQAVRARLLTERALTLPVSLRPRAFAEAAQAYASADALVPQLYTRINAATMTLLAGDADRARDMAEAVLAWLDTGPQVHDTPFMIEASRAEAHLVAGRTEAARRVLVEAVALAPLAFEDHALALRQFRMIARALKIDDRWLDAFRPPAAMHFAGHLGLGSRPDPVVVGRIDAAIAADRVGFGFGALAAGSDITIAERLLESGGELHVVLPLCEEAFLAQSVHPFGEDWEERFRRCRDAAASWTETARNTGTYEPIASHLAADVAMGAAVRHARSLGSDAVQIVIVDDGPGALGTGVHTAREVRRWSGTGLSSHVIRAPRTAPVPSSGSRAVPEGQADRRLVALLQMDFIGLAELDEAALAQAVADVLVPFRSALAMLPARPALALPCGNSRIMAFTDPESAFAYARAALDIPTAPFALRVAGHYGLAHWLSDPDALIGRTVDQLAEVAALAFPGTITVTETFASALFLAAGGEVYAEPLGEAGDLRLHALRVTTEGSAA